MNRLTAERVNGIKRGYWSAAKKQELVDALAAYENTELTPEEIRTLKNRTKWQTPADAPLKKRVLVKTKDLEWIADYNSDWVPEEEKTRHPEQIVITIGFKTERESGEWICEDPSDGEKYAASEKENPDRSPEMLETVVLGWMELPE